MKIKAENRFNNREYWIMGNGDAIAIKDMETNHLINTLRMFQEKPNRTLAMLINDAEQTCSFFGNEKNIISQITSMDRSELIAYAMASALAETMLDELENRGVNVDCVLAIQNGAIADLPR